MYLPTGPDGALYVADFYEEFIAHGQNYQGQIDPTTGRVYRLRGKDATLEKDVNLSARPPAQLVETLSHPNRWHRQTAVRLLGERRDPPRPPAAEGDCCKSSETHPALEALWALHQMGGLDEATDAGGAGAPAPPVRAWAVRLIGGRGTIADRVFAGACETGRDGKRTPRSAARSRRRPGGSPAEQALPLVATLLRRDADAADPFIPLLCWWTIESHCDAEPGRRAGAAERRRRRGSRRRCVTRSCRG